MSKLTEVLKLFCYDPETDGANTFNIPKALNENWEKIDQLVLLAVAAAAAYDPEGSYTVGDYCTHGGKLHKCGTEIPDGEAWNAEHWTETTVTAELAEVRASLSNKATNLGRVSSPYETVLDVVLSCTTDSSFFVDNASSIYNAADAPFGLTETQYLVSMDGTKTRRTVFAILYDPAKKPQIAIRPAFNDAWILDWTYIPIITPPEEYDLPMADGITALQPCTYYKNQFSEVTLGGCTSGSVSDGATIATLPEGFRPDHPVERPASFTSNGNRYAGSVFIAANGIVSIHTPAAATNVVFAASFPAKN